MTIEEGVVEKKQEGKRVLVGIRIDSNDRELLNWALSEVAEPGDHVVAIHISKNSEISSKETPSMLCLVQTLNRYLAVYEGFCNVKQVDLVGQICWGNSIRKVLVREAKLCAATTVVVGISKHNALGGSVSLAKYCVKRLPSTTSVLAVYNGKVIFRRSATKQQPGLKADVKPSLRSLFDKNLGMESKVLITGCKKNADFEDWKVTEREQNPPLVGKDYLVKPNKNETVGLSSRVSLNSIDSETLEEVENGHSPLVCKQRVEVDSSSASLLIKMLPESKLGWPLLQRTISEVPGSLSDTEARKMSVVKWVMNLPNRSLPSTPQPLGSNKAENPFGRDKPNCGRDGNSGLPKELDIILGTNSSSCRWFSHTELHSSTKFSSENLIGKGGCSQVYKGRLPEGKPVAVKISEPSKEASKNFLLEVNIITALQHKNIVPLIGVCVEDNDLVSVYEFLSKGSLEENLHGSRRAKCALPWEVRFKVATGVAEALNYLHSGCSRPVIHRDVKSSNILLSEEFEPQLSDFGLAIWAPTTSSYVIQGDVVGTFGYLAPEYFMYGKVSDKIDVYSFGVVLLELLSGRKPISNDNPKGQESLVMWATPILESGDATKLLDPNLAGRFDKNQMSRMVLAVSLCITRSARLRPKMSQILELLQGNEEVEEWSNTHLNVHKETENDNQDEEAYPASSVQTHLGLALLDVENDSTSFSSMEQQNNHNSLEDYLQGRWSRSSSLD